MQKLTIEQKQAIIEAGKIEMPLGNLAIILDMSLTNLEMEFVDLDSKIFRIYEKSRIKTNNAIIQALTEKALAGDKAAVKVRDQFIGNTKFRYERDKLVRRY